jgi:DNA-binding transcriptional regulator YdaS (Cro superfamily)
MQPALKKAIDVAGNASALARMIGVSPGYARHLGTGTRPITPAIAVQIERATGVKAEALMPETQWLRARGKLTGYVVSVE